MYATLLLEQIHTNKTIYEEQDNLLSILRKQIFEHCFDDGNRLCVSEDDGESIPQLQCKKFCFCLGMCALHMYTPPSFVKSACQSTLFVKIIYFTIFLHNKMYYFWILTLIIFTSLLLISTPFVCFWLHLCFRVCTILVLAV